VTRKRTYLLVRLGAFTVLVAAATLLPRGVPAALLVVAAGVVAVVSSLWANAGGPGERAGARPQDRWFDSVMPPQGDWPPYEEPAEPAPTSQATLRPPQAS
jgi:hypothetical protein